MSTYSIKVTDRTGRDVVDIDIDDDDVAKLLQPIAKELGQRATALRAVAMFAGLTDEQVQKIFVDGLKAMTSYVTAQTPRAGFSTSAAPAEAAGRKGSTAPDESGASVPRPNRRQLAS